MGQKNEDRNYILIDFKGTESMFDLQIKSHNELFTALMGLEGYACSMLGLDIKDIREIVDEMKANHIAKPKPIVEESIDAGNEKMLDGEDKPDDERSF